MNNSSAHDLLNQALTLSEADRLWLADELIISVKPPGVMSVDDPGFEAEIMRRSQEIHDGTAELVAAEEAMESIRKAIAKGSVERKSRGT